MNPIPWLLLLLPKRYRKYVYLVLFAATLLLGSMLIVKPFSERNIGQIFVVMIIIGIFVLSYWYGWKKESK